MTDGERPADPLSAQRVGERLSAERSALGLSLAEVASRTRIPLRHLEAIEQGNYAALPSPTYAVGFVRAYARTVGGDEVGYARDVRAEVAQQGRRTPQYQAYEIADPARTPSRGVVVVATGVALAVLVLGLLWFAGGMMGRPSTNPATRPATPPVAVALPAAAPGRLASAGGGQVTLAATDTVWLRVYDAADKTLYIGTMQPGNRFDVPRDANDPKINVGRPDKLQVSLNGAAVPPLGDGARPIKDVRVSASAVAARLHGAAPGDAAAVPVGVSPQPAPSPSAAPAAAVPTSSTRPRAAATPRPRPTARATARPGGPENLLPSAFGDGA